MARIKKIVTVTVIATSAFFFSACTSSGVDMAKQTPGFQNGATAGCETAKGAYTKDSTAWSNDMDYQEGWFYGRKKCNPSDSRS